LALGLLHRRRSSRQAAMMMTIQVMAIQTSAATMEILARPSRAVRARTSRADGQTWTSSACWHTRKLGVDLWQVPRQDSARNTYALEYDTAQRRVGSLPGGTPMSFEPLIRAVHQRSSSHFTYHLATQEGASWKSLKIRSTLRNVHTHIFEETPRKR
jgi:hypothetical protein